MFMVELLMLAYPNIFENIEQLLTVLDELTAKLIGKPMSPCSSGAIVLTAKSCRLEGTIAVDLEMTGGRGCLQLCFGNWNRNGSQ